MPRSLAFADDTAGTDASVSTSTSANSDSNWDVTSAPLVVEDPAPAADDAAATPAPEAPADASAAAPAAADSETPAAVADEAAPADGDSTAAPQAEEEVAETPETVPLGKHAAGTVNHADGPSRGETGDGTLAESAADARPENEEDLTGKTSANYFAILYGPSVEKPGEYQPSPYGDRDPSRPVELKNFAGFSYNIDKDTAITPTVYWSWYAGEQQFTMNDPFLRLSRTNVIDSQLFNLYSDVRVHFPASRESQDDHLLTGIQTFHSLAFQVGDSPVALGLYGSARVNFFGNQGFGNDLELYMGPNMFFQIARHASLTLLYEEQLNHQYGAKAFHFWTPGSDLEPGVAWDVSPNLMLNPYLNLNTGGQIALSTTSFGMMLNWRMF